MDRTSWVVTGILSFILTLVIGGSVLYKDYVFNRDCGSYLKLAADASTVDTAQERLKTALDFIEIKDLTKGNTAIFFETPSEDLELWYKNLQDAYAVLEASKYLPDNSVEKTNSLIKLRETLMDTSNGSAEVTVPSNISLFPNQFFIYLMLFLTIITGTISSRRLTN